MQHNNFEAQFLDVFKSIDLSKRRHEVFRDFTAMSAFSLFNVFAKSDEIEKKYMDIVSRYSKDNVKKLTELLAITVLALESKPSDFLGRLYMQLNFGENSKGQFFTPDEVSKMMAKISFSGAETLLSEKGFITLSDPAVGMGGMIINFAEIMKEEGYSPHECLWVQGIDVDETIAFACYVQLSLLGIPGQIIVGNSLSMEFRKSLYTPFHFLFEWESKFRMTESIDRFKNILKSISCSEDKGNDVIIVPSLKERNEILDQMSLFDI